MSLQAYQRAAQKAETPREMEYRLFGQVTRALVDASQSDANDFARRMDALDWNRLLWSTLSTACQSDDNRLPVELRAQIISLALFINRHTSEVMRGDEDWESLIDINRMIMQGLMGGR